MVYSRLKKQVPFSNRLNEWIKERVKTISYFPYEGLEEMSFEDFKSEVKTRGSMPISSDHCEGTIFGDPEVNIMFRAWHDKIHLDLDEGFGYMEEARVAFAQISELPEDWKEEKLLILTEVIGQAAYHEKTGQFIENQREFTISVLEKGVI